MQRKNYNGANRIIEIFIFSPVFLFTLPSSFLAINDALAANVKPAKILAPINKKLGTNNNLERYAYKTLI